MPTTSAFRSSVAATSCRRGSSRPSTTPKAARRGYDRFVFSVCLAYGSREEILDAIRAIAEDHAKGELALEAIDEAAVSDRLYTADMPDPDLVIRTSGEERISNFLLWQMAYAELYFTDVYWPSFSKRELLKAIKAFQQRKRRYGA